jgi:3-deoxy-D-manno-octulosonic-acid transferase
MLYLIYDILLFLAIPIIIPFYLFRYLRKGRLRKGIGERLGFLSGEKKSLLAGHDTIWVHAVSVGETMAARPLLKALKARYPGHRIVLSSVTETGQGIGESIGDVDLCIYFPFDFRFSVNRLLKTIRPSLIVVVETEIWPNFLRYARLLDIPVVLANGRISDKSFGGYRRFAWVFRSVLPNFSALCMQTEEDARRIVAIGAPPSRVSVTKNLKYDLPVRIASDERKAELRSTYRIPSGVPVITAGSTHQGEEEALLTAFRDLMDEGREVFLVLAPRHPERAEEVSVLLERMGIPFARRSSLSSHARDFRRGEALLLDSVGELMGIYSLSDLVFVGGSLVPVGGHNLLEPASVGVPVLFGPHMNNFREIASKILFSAAGVQVREASLLPSVVRDLLDNPAAREEMGGNGARLLVENRGATERHMEIIRTFFPEKVPCSLPR